MNYLQNCQRITDGLDELILSTETGIYRDVLTNFNIIFLSFLDAAKIVNFNFKTPVFAREESNDLIPGDERTIRIPKNKGTIRLSGIGRQKNGIIEYQLDRISAKILEETLAKGISKDFEEVSELIQEEIRRRLGIKEPTTKLHLK